MKTLAALLIAIVIAVVGAAVFSIGDVKADHDRCVDDNTTVPVQFEPLGQGHVPYLGYPSGRIVFNWIVKSGTEQVFVGGRDECTFYTTGAILHRAEIVDGVRGVFWRTIRTSQGHHSPIRRGIFQDRPPENREFAYRVEVMRKIDHLNGPDEVITSHFSDVVEVDSFVPTEEAFVGTTHSVNVEGSALFVLSVRVAHAWRYKVVWNEVGQTNYETVYIDAVPGTTISKALSDSASSSAYHMIWMSPCPKVIYGDESLEPCDYADKWTYELVAPNES